jgi:hypothetical protein
VNPDTQCEHVRPRLMAAIDGETDAASAADRAHLVNCAPCQQWLDGLEHLCHRLRQLTYPDPRADLWTALEPRIHALQAKPDVGRRLWVIGALVLGWRVLQLLIDLPLPVLHPLVPIAAVVAALWRLAGNPFAVTTFAPELHKRGA